MSRKRLWQALKVWNKQWVYFVSTTFISLSASFWQDPYLTSFPFHCCINTGLKRWRSNWEYLLLLGSIHIKWLTATVTHGAHTYMQAFTCEIKITNKSFLKECKLHQIVLLRPYDALRVIKGGEQRLMMPVARSTSLKQGLSWSTVSLQTEPLALTQWGDVEMVFLENSFHNNRKQSSMNSHGIKRFFLLFLKVSRFQWLRNGIRYQATCNVFWSQIWPRVAAISMKVLKVSGKGWGRWIRTMERKERQQAKADRESDCESSKLIKEWKSTSTLLFLFPSILGVKERGKVTTMTST